jgi:hypothetical protein
MEDSYELSSVISNVIQIELLARVKSKRNLTRLIVRFGVMYKRYGVTYYSIR